MYPGIKVISTIVELRNDYGDVITFEIRNDEDLYKPPESDPIYKEDES